jgi:Flp pilus assembly protein TadG
MRRSQRPTRAHERGAIAVLAAIMVMLLGAFLALALNTGHKMNTKAQLQQAYDAAVLAGAATFNGTPAGVAQAKLAAIRFATAHNLDKAAVGVSASDVTVGYWDKKTSRFFAEGSSVTIGEAAITLDRDKNPQYFTAVKIGAATDGTGSHNSPMDVWFSSFVGNRATMQVYAGAIGVGGGPCVESGCALPLAIPSCALVDSGGYVLCGTVQTLYFNHGQGKDIALADVTQPSNHVDNAEERQQMAAGAACTNPDVEVNDVIRLGNGNDFNKQVDDAMHAPHNIVCAAAAPYTGCPRRQIPVTNTDCTAPMNGYSTVVGFAHVVVVDTNPSGRDASISFYIDCSGTSTSESGCANFGFGSTKLRLVQ